MSLSCTILNASDPKSGTARTGAKVIRGEPTGGTYSELSTQTPATVPAGAAPAANLPSDGFCNILTPDDVAYAFDAKVEEVQNPTDYPNSAPMRPTSAIGM